MPTLHTITVGHRYGTSHSDHGELIPRGHDKVVEVAQSYFSGFTVTAGTGFWRGISEPVTIVQVEHDFPETVRDFAESLKAAMFQDAVMHTTQTIEVEY